MKNIIYIFIAFTFIASFSSCYKEAALTATDTNQGYVVPQGTSDYDTTILNFYNKYGKYLLYKFSDKDTYWTPSGWKNSTLSTTLTGYWSPGYLVTQADPTYVKKQLKLLDTTCFRLYTDTFLKVFLPSKIMLCATVDSVYPIVIFTTTPVSYNKGVKSVAAWYNYDNICVNNARSVIDSMTAADKKAYLARVNLIFAQSIIGRNLVSATSTFASIANYGATINTTALRYAQGIIYNSSTSTADLDWGAYILAMVSTSEKNLNTSVVATDATYNGILNATKDVNGRIKSRYNLVRNYYITNYNVDFQAVGNAAN